MEKILLILTLALVSCEQQEKHTTKRVDNSDLMINFKIVTIDSCEYVSDTYVNYNICHKGNCKYCLMRKK